MAPLRRNLAHLSEAEREHFARVVREIDLPSFSDGVSYWDKQDQIHQGTHNHGGNSFIPWHRELCNRFEKLLQRVDPNIALHYWDWTQSPRAASNGAGGTVNLCRDATMGTPIGMVAGTLAPLHNGGILPGSRDATGNPADAPTAIRRNLDPGAPGVPSDSTILQSADSSPQPEQWGAFRVALENAHNTTHDYFGDGSNIKFPHSSFEDPFVFLLHSNVDRLFAMWQSRPGQEWRLDPDQVYGNQKDTSDDVGILRNLQPWDGTVAFGPPIPPWDGSAPGAIETKNCRHPTVVAPPCYDTLPVTVQQIAPTPPDPIRFRDVYAGEDAARALRLRVRACRPVTCNASISGDPGFRLLSSSLTSPEPSSFKSYDLLVWVLFTPGAPGSMATATLQVDVPDPGPSFTVPIVANVIAKPTVATSLVLDRSGSMDGPSGIGSRTRMEILKSSAPLFVHLLDDDDGIGVVRFDSDAQTAPPADTVERAGPRSGGPGRDDALQAIASHATNPLGSTAIGDGLEVAAGQLAASSGFASTATVVFTDGHETAAKMIDEVTDLITSRVFAIGLGTADQLNPGALDRLVARTKGYLLLTGNLGPDDQMLLQKYFAQILAGVTNAAIVVDPKGFVRPGEEAVIPYDLTMADSRSDVIVLSPMAELLTVVLEAPGGEIIDGSSGADLVATDEYRALRLDLSSSAISGPSGGRWQARLEVDKRRFSALLGKLEDEEEVNRLQAHGVPFLLTTQARSSLRLGVEVMQLSRLPGSGATLTTTLTESGILLGAAVVDADVTAPDGSSSVLRLEEAEPGVHRGAVKTTAAGVYRVLVRATGVSLRGERFTREELRTVAVWWRGDDQVPPAVRGEPDICRLIDCLLEDEGLVRLAEKRGIDLERLRRCSGCGGAERSLRDGLAASRRS